MQLLFSELDGSTTQHPVADTLRRPGGVTIAAVALAMLAMVPHVSSQACTTISGFGTATAGGCGSREVSRTAGSYTVMSDGEHTIPQFRFDYNANQRGSTISIGLQVFVGGVQVNGNGWVRIGSAGGGHCCGQYSYCPGGGWRAYRAGPYTVAGLQPGSHVIEFRLRAMTGGWGCDGVTCNHVYMKLDSQQMSVCPPITTTATTTVTSSVTSTATSTATTSLTTSGTSSITTSMSSTGTSTATMTVTTTATTSRTTSATSTATTTMTTSATTTATSTLTMAPTAVPTTVPTVAPSSQITGGELANAADNSNGDSPPGLLYAVIILSILLCFAVTIAFIFARQAETMRKLLMTEKSKAKGSGAKQNPVYETQNHHSNTYSELAPPQSNQNGYLHVESTDDNGGFQQARQYSHITYDD